MKINDKRVQSKINRAQKLIKTINLDSKNAELSELEEIVNKPDFWQKNEAKDMMTKLSSLRDELNRVRYLDKLVADLNAFLELAGNEGLSQNLNIEFNKNYNELVRLIAELELEMFLSGKFDNKGAIFSIHPGQGGTEAMDWAEMLSRMYLRYFERKGWKFSLVDEIKGEDAGIKEVVYEINQSFAYGLLKNERGTHRLVRLSPFNADHLRQTSFALVEVLPIIDNDKDIDLNDGDISWNFTRSGGAGGQSVNKVNSAVELIHEPTGIVVKCREERSQVQNKEKALKILKSKLAALEEEKTIKELAQVKGKHQHASWGNQIRNYVLHPYQLVKDTRTDVETQDTQSVLDGDIDRFIQAAVRLR